MELKCRCSISWLLNIICQMFFLIILGMPHSRKNETEITESTFTKLINQGKSHTHHIVFFSFPKNVRKRMITGLKNNICPLY